MFDHTPPVLRRIALVLGISVLLAACAGSPAGSPHQTAVRSSEPTTSMAPTESAPSETASQSTSAGAVTSFVGEHLRGSRQPVLDVLADLGYQCGAERPNPPDVPTIVCTFSGAGVNEAVVMFAAADDFRGVGLFTYDRNRMAEFLAAMGSEDISGSLMDGLGRIADMGTLPDSICPLPCESDRSGEDLGNIEARTSVYEDLLLFVALQEVDF